MIVSTNDFFARPTATVSTAALQQMGAAVDTVDDSLPVELGGRPKWVMPVAISGAVLAAGGAFLLMKKKKGGAK